MFASRYFTSILMMICMATTIVITCEARIPLGLPFVRSGAKVLPWLTPEGSDNGDEYLFAEDGLRPSWQRREAMVRKASSSPRIKNCNLSDDEDHDDDRITTDAVIRPGDEHGTTTMQSAFWKACRPVSRKSTPFLLQLQIV